MVAVVSPIEDLRSELRRLRSRHQELSARIRDCRRAGGDFRPLAVQDAGVCGEIRRLREEISSRTRAVGAAGGLSAGAEAPDLGTDAWADDRDIAGLRTEVIVSIDGFDRLADDWRTLAANAEPHGPNLTWEWMDAWLAGDRRGRRLFIITVRDARCGLIGLAPLMASARRGGGRPNLVFMGTDGTVYYTALDFLCRSGLGAAARTAIFAELGRRRTEFGSVVLQRLPTGGPGFAATVRAAGAAGFDMTIESPAGNSVDTLPADFASFVRQVPDAGRRKGLRTWRRKLAERRRKVEIAEIAGETPAEQLMELFRPLHAARWRAEGHEGYFSKPGWAEFAVRMWAGFRAAGALRFHLLRIDGRPAAAEVGVAYRGTYFGFHRGRLPEYAGDGIGHAIMGWCLEQAVAEGLGAVDLGMAEGMPYKREYLRQTAPVATATFFDGRPMTLARQGLRLLRRAAFGWLQR